ncbi:aspartate ammonia-lyase [bacterium SM23_31]|nr:MAG: aspartate ammonia-lyase [bacterium SM23_31]
MKNTWRIERDSMGEVRIPKDALYGAQTRRAVENFPISGIKVSPPFINAYVLLKKAAAIANNKLGILDPERSSAINEAADEILGGKYHEHFVVDVFQAGAGTSFNMNVNEVLANLAVERLGRRRGDRYVHPNDHVNMGQSTNDTFPTAMRIAARLELRKLYPVLNELIASFRKKGREFDSIIKSGRTHLQDAVPVRLGQEFTAYASAIDKVKGLVRDSEKSISELGIGGSAVGTGLNVHPDYTNIIVEKISKLTGLRFTPAPDLFEAMQSQMPVAHVSGALKILALEMTRIANDLRLLSSGPAAGFGEIILPPVQPGSSIMPGKVNPVMAEMLNMVCFQVMGNDTAVSMSVQAGQMELNVMMPEMAFSLLMSIQILTNALEVFRIGCVDGITANRERCKNYFDRSVGLATILNTYIGYDKAAQIAKESVETGRSIPELILEKKLMSENELKRILNIKTVTEPGIPGKKD